MAEVLTLSKKKTSFLKNYTLNNGFIQKANKLKGIPKIKDGVDKDGNYVIIKIWEREKSLDDSDLREIWRNELRQLHRLAGFPGASEYISELKETYEDEGGFYIVISPGQKSFLATHLTNSNTSTPTEQERVIFWNNIKRAALGINILHSQGMLHRKVDEWAVLTEGSFDQEDFELTGFEWSMRLSSKLTQNNVTGASYSFIDDWKGLGNIAAKGLNINSKKLYSHSVSSSEVSNAITTEEIILIRELLQVKPAPKISFEDIEKSIKEIEGKLLTRQNSGSQKLKIAFSIGDNGKLSSTIKKLSNNKIETDSTSEQLLFIENDLTSPQLIISETGNISLIGAQLTYFLKDYASPADKSKSNWSIAYCERADTQRPIIKENTRIISLGANNLDFLSLAKARQEYGKPRSKINTWRPLIQKTPSTKKRSEQNEHIREFWLIQIIDYLFSLADFHPIEISNANAADDGINTITINSRYDERFESITKLLGIKDTPTVRLAENLNSEENKTNNNWKIINTLYLGKNRQNDTQWHYTGEPKSNVFTLTGESEAPKEGDFYLVPPDQKGTYAQFMRRAKSLKALAEHNELLEMLINPRAKIKSSHDDITEDDHYTHLDHSKKEALKKLISTIPLFLVQGPPGVGKTKLIKELVRRRYTEEPTDRFLLTAQSNSATDHLLDQVSEIFPSNSRPLIIRCGKNDADEGMSDLKRQSAKIVNDIISSDIFKNSSPHIQEKLNNLNSHYSQTLININKPARTSSATRTFEGLLLRSANFVFATTNAPELERLIEERGQFDWTIIEEAGKATGGELLSPLLLSYRRLMIGDHKQLPPFNSEKVKSVLLNNESLREALFLSRSIISSELLDNTANDLFNIPESSEETEEGAENNFPETCRKSISKLFLFEQLIEDELDFQQQNPKSKIIASPLNIQHRMHPAIADLVSQCFYKNKLETSEERIKYCESTSPPVFLKNTSDEFQLPITWIDMPWVQNTIGKQVGEETPRYTNREEIEAIQIVIENLESNLDTKPSLAILSPYRRQVKSIREHLESQPALMTHLETMFSIQGAAAPCHTVDSFQGNEADVVIISLVRNNNAPNIKSALGFLTDSRRTNVLLSRARSKLIIIGSLDFLESNFLQARSDEDKDKVEPIRKLVSLIRHAEGKSSKIINYTEIRGWKK